MMQSMVKKINSGQLAAVPWHTSSALTCKADLGISPPLTHSNLVLTQKRTSYNLAPQACQRV